MAKKLGKLESQLNELEQDVERVRQWLSVLSPLEESASPRADLDTTLDCFFEMVGVQGELSGLAHLRALQAEQERLWASQQNGASSVDRSSRRKKKSARGKDG